MSSRGQESGLSFEQVTTYIQILYKLPNHLDNLNIVFKDFLWLLLGLNGRDTYIKPTLTFNQLQGNIREGVQKKSTFFRKKS